MSTRKALSPEQRATVEKAQRLQMRKNRDDLKKVLATPEGQRVMIRLVTRCGIMRAGYEGNGSRAYFDAGVRQVGTEVAREIAALRPELLVQVLTPEAAPPPPSEEEFDDDGE